MKLGDLLTGVGSIGTIIMFIWLFNMNWKAMLVAIGIVLGFILLICIAQWIGDNWDNWMNIKLW